MKNLNLSKKSIATIFLSILLVSSMFIVFASAEIGGSDRTTEDLEARVDPITGLPYGNLTQYEWVSAANGGENQRYNAGPAPNVPSLSWSKTIGSSASMSTVFNGKLFIYSGTTIYALDPYTGETIFTTAMNGSAQGTTNGDIVKYNDDLFGYFSTTGAVWYNMTTGQQLGKTIFSEDSGAYGFTALGAGGSAKYWGRMYDYESNTFIGVTVSNIDGKPLAVAVDCSDLLNQGAPVKWIATLETGIEALGFGGGNAYFGGYGEGILYAIDIASGDLVWTANKEGNFGYSLTYYNGVVYHCASSTEITAIDGATGATLATFDAAGGRAFFSYGGAAAYGMYFDSSIQIPQGWTSAWNAETLEQLWKQPSEFYIKYLVGMVADGKFITTTCDRAAGSDLGGGNAKSDGYRVTAFDVFTGQEIWNIATASQVFCPTVAYGNLYMSVGSVLYCYVEGGANADGTTGWSSFGGSTGTNGAQTDLGQYPADITESLWDFQADGPITGSPVVVDGYAYFGTFKSHAGTLYCVDINTVEAVWTFPIEARILSTPAVVDGVVYTGADDGTFYALNATTGAKIWERYAGGVTQGPVQFAALQLNPSPIVYNDRVVCAAQDGNLYCLNANTGAIIWKDALSDTRWGIAATAAIVPDDLLGRTKVVIMANSTLFSINFNDGAILTREVLYLRNRERVNTTYPLIQVGKPNVVGDLVFISMGTGVYGEARIYNATTMEKLCATLNTLGSGSTPALACPAYIPDYTVVIPNGTNLGWGTSNAEQFIVNETTTMRTNVVIAIESQIVSGWVLVANGTNLGTGTSQSTRWIVNSTTAYYMVRVWDNWVGHQSFGNPVVAINAQTPGMNAIVYEGNSVYGFTAYNCTDGTILSTYTAQAQVFTTPALYQNRLYMTDSAGYLHCFANTDPTFSIPVASIFASSNKGAEMFANEEMLIEGQLSATQTFATDIISPEDFHPPLPYTTVYLTVVNPDGTSNTESAVTDANGNFNFTITPTQTGQTQWLVYFEGMQTLDGNYMEGAYSAYSTVDVVSQGGSPSDTSSPSGEATPVPPIAMEYIYAIVGIIVALIVVVAVVMLLRNRKK